MQVSRPEFCTSLAVIQITGSKDISFPFRSRLADQLIPIEYPAFFVKKPDAAMRTIVVPKIALLEPVIVMRYSDIATQYMATSLFMPKN